MAKCEVISEAKAFKPVTLQVTLESQAEVDALDYILTCTCCSNSYKSERFRVAETILEKVREYVG